MRIAIFADNFYPELSGIADTVLVTGKEFAEMGHQVTFFVPKYTKKEFDITGTEHKELNLHKNITIKRVSSFGYPTATKQGRGTIPNIFRGFFYRNKFDVVHTHSFFAFGVEAYFFAKINNIPLVGTNHTVIESFLEFAPPPVRKYLPKYLIWFYNRCIFLTTPSEFLLDKMKRGGSIVEHKVISNPIEKDFFVSEEQKSEIQNSIKDKKFTFLYVGRISSEKNVEILIDAFNLFIKNNNYENIELVLVGGGALRDYLENKIEKLNLKDKIKMVGPFMGEAKKNLYDIFKTSDTFLTASTSETQCMTLLQAMASSTPSLVAYSGPLPELVLPNRGFTFEPENKEEIVECMNKIYLDQGVRKSMGNEAYKYVEKYSTQNIALLWEEVYDQVIKKYKNRKI